MLPELDRYPDVVRHGGEEMFAHMSACGLYRYTLGRVWDLSLPTLVAICLNPSTANEREDDPTVRRLRGFAERDGCGALLLGNLFAYRATHPRELRRAMHGGVDVYGGLPAWTTLHQLLSLQCSIRLAAWGALRPEWCGRALNVLELGIELGANWKCLGVSKSGHPRHPLYLPNAERLRGFYRERWCDPRASVRERARCKEVLP